MPWFIWMCFLTVPVMVGVACTLASNHANDPKGINTVAIAAGIWPAWKPPWNSSK